MTSVEIPAPVNAPVVFTDRFIAALEDGGAKAAKAALVGYFPFFAWPGLSQLADYIINGVTKILGGWVALQTDYLIIDHQTANEAAGYKAAVETLRADLKNDADRAAFDEKLKKLIRF